MAPLFGNGMGSTEIQMTKFHLCSMLMPRWYLISNLMGRKFLEDKKRTLKFCLTLLEVQLLAALLRLVHW